MLAVPLLNLIAPVIALAWAVDAAWKLATGDFLYGGTSYCTAQSSPDYYSRFSDVYASISTYFNP